MKALRGREAKCFAHICSQVSREAMKSTRAALKGVLS